jgi:hypothetical protein
VRARSPGAAAATGSSLATALACALVVACGADVSGPSPSLSGAVAGSSPPRSATATRGRLVEGFPSATVPLPPGATVEASGVERSATGLDVSVTATSELDVAAVVAFYTDALGRVGFTATAGVLPTGTSGAAFSRSAGTETLVVAVVDRGDHRSFSVGGTLTR